MAESIIQVAPDSTGKKLHTWSYPVGANTVEDEVVVQGPQPWPTYVAVAGSVSIATANDHIMCLNAGASLKLRIIRIRLEQSSNATASATGTFQLLRTTTGAPTGGTAVTPAPYDTADTAGATARTLPAVKGTESTMLNQQAVTMRQTVAAAGTQVDDGWEWVYNGHGKPIIVPAGTTNGLVIKSITAIAGCTVNVSIEFVETAF